MLHAITKGDPGNQSTPSSTVITLFTDNLYKVQSLYNTPCYSTFKYIQGSHRLEKYLNLEGFLENALKSTGKSLKSLENSLNSTIFL